MFLIAQISASFVAPTLAAVGMAAVSIPLLIHLLSRLRRQRQQWAAMQFLYEAFRRHKRRLQFEQWLLLLVRCLLLLTLSLALAGPLLTGCAARVASGFSAGGRAIHLVLDDSLSTRVLVTAQKTRFDRLRDTALLIAETAEPNDTVTLWNSARPLRGPVESVVAARHSLEKATPRYSDSCLVNALMSIQERLDGRPTAVVLLSDFSRSVSELDRPLPQELEGLGKQVNVLVSRPAPSASNVQISALSAQRRRLFGRFGGGLNVPIQLWLRRFDNVSAEAHATVDVMLTEPDGDVLVSTTRRARWAPGQIICGLNLDVPVESSLRSETIPITRTMGAEQPLVLRARLSPQSMFDALKDDNHRTFVLELQHQMRVGLIDELPSSVDMSAPSPAQWLAMALVPLSGTEPHPLALEHLLVADVHNNTLGRLDAVMVLRPDLLTDSVWQRLHEFAVVGGLVWIFVPPDGNTALWPQSMAQAFDLRWEIELEPTSSGPEAWELNGAASVPSPLGVLSAEWESLLRPVRVYQRLAVSTAHTQRWIGLANDGGSDSLLAVERVGDGVVLMLNSALDQQWTNLPTKPLFVPLIHETLRGLLGGPADTESRFVAGRRLVLGRNWMGAGRLDPIDNPGPSIALGVLAQSIEGVEPAQTPGLYQAAEGPQRVLAVNVPADAGDCRAVGEKKLAQWLDGLGNWSFMDPHNPASALVRQVETTNIGWGLLWIALGLLLLEMALARVMSHAVDGARRSWTDRWAQSLGRMARARKRLLSGPFSMKEAA